MSFWTIFRDGIRSSVQGFLLIDPATGQPVTPLTDAQMRASAMPVTAGQLTTATATIANGQSLSDAVDLGLMRIGRIVMPEVASGWTAADLTMQTSHDGVTWSNQYDDSRVEYQIKVDAGHSQWVPLDKMMSVRFVKFRSGTAAAPVPQAADRSIILVLVP
jgi:hypothetical protein